MRWIDSNRPQVAVEVVEALGIKARMKGLLGRDRLEPGRGMLLRGRQVHTFGMRFPIDAVYISADGIVLRISTLRPGRIGPYVRHARFVFEMAAGECERLGIQAGTTMTKESHE